MTHWPELGTWAQTRDLEMPSYPFPQPAGKVKYLMNSTHDHHTMSEIKFFTEQENLELGLEEEVSNEAGNKEGCLRLMGFTET